MIYGLNFNNTVIPTEVRSRFRDKIKLEGMSRGDYAHLVGVCETNEELASMRLQAERPGRALHTVDKRFGGVNWVAVYAYTTQ